MFVSGCLAVRGLASTMVVSLRERELSCELSSTPPDTNRGLACAKQPVCVRLLFQCRRGGLGGGGAALFVYSQTRITPGFGLTGPVGREPLDRGCAAQQPALTLTDACTDSLGLAWDTPHV